MDTGRKVIQICAQEVPCGERGFSVIHALCNDGTIWVMGTYQNWTMLPPIPQENFAGDPA